MLKAFILSFLIIVATAHTSKLELIYVPKTGRVKCRGGARPTHSVFWDRIAQDVAASAAKGPTISAGLYGMMHSAIFYAWAQSCQHEYRSYSPTLMDEYEPKSNPFCTLKKLSMSQAAYHTISSIMPEGRRVAAKAFTTLHSGCQYTRFYAVAKKIGIYSAWKIIIRYDRNVLSANQPRFTHSSSIEKWRPERVPIDSENGTLQTYLTRDWGRRFTFGIRDGSIIRVKNPEPVLLVLGTLDVDTAKITLNDGVELDVSPDLVGEIINPAFIRQAERIVKASANLTETQKFIAEFWEQGEQTPFPPGVWMTFAQYVSFRDRHTDDEDVGLFYAMGNAMNDAGVSTWYIKLFYNYARPVRVIRDLGKLGLLGIRKWYNIVQGGVATAPVTKFLTYQRADSDPSPPFPEYTSGHSTFSASGAEVLRKWTGSDYFGGNVSIKAKKSRFETETFPTRDLLLKWSTFTSAANQAGISRIYGGIHFDDGNTEGLISGKIIGEHAFWKALRQWKLRHVNWE